MKRTKAMRTNAIGTTATQREDVLHALNVALANTYVLLTKTRRAHWGVVGPQFTTLHKLWDEQHTTLSEIASKTAERIRVLGGCHLRALHVLLAAAELQEDPAHLPSARESVRTLLQDHEAVVWSLRTSIERCEKAWGDGRTAELLARIMGQHAKMAWTLRSLASLSERAPGLTAARLDVAKRSAEISRIA